MRVAIIGRSELMYKTAELFEKNGFQIPLVVTAKAAPEYKATARDFEKLASRNGAEYIYSPNINAPEIKNKIINIRDIDIAVSINYSGVISQDIINIFPKGILNAHGGDLPKYRGNACQAWAILNKESKVGLCIHKMIGGELDSGNIIDRKYHPININTRIEDLYLWMENEIPPMMLAAVQKLSVDCNYFLEEQSKNPVDSLRCYPRIPEDGRIYWNSANDDIIRLINCSSEPFAGAYCNYDNQKMIIWKAQEFNDDENYLAIPGQIASINIDGSVVVITGRSKIKLNEVEYNGVRGLPSAFIKSIRRRLT